MRAPYAYNQTGRDVLGGLSQSAAVGNEMAARQKQDDMGMRGRQFAQEYALQGLRNQMASQQYSNDLANTRLQSLYGGLGNLLRGLYSQ